MDDLDTCIKVLNEKVNEENLHPRRLLTIGEIRKEKCEPIEFIFHPWFNKQGIVLVFAERGVGKTYFALNVAHAISRGGEFLNGYAEHPKKVLYIDGEMPFFSIKERIALIDNMYENAPDDNFIILTPDKYNHNVPDLSTEEGQNIINAHIEDIGAEVLVIDNIATLMPKLKGNDNDAWARIIQPWLLTLRRKNISTLIVHHSGKPKKDEAPSGRGSSGKEDVLDTVISLTRPVGYTAEQGARFNVEFTKNRHFHGSQAQAFEAWLKEDDNHKLSWFTDNMKDSTFVQVCQLMNSGLMQKEIVSKLRVSKQRVSVLVTKGIKEGKINKIIDQFSPFAPK